MATRVEVGLKEHLFDARGDRVKRHIVHAFPHLRPPETVLCFDVYHVAQDLPHDALAEAFCDPVIQDMSLDASLRRRPGWYIEVGFKPGVTDNVGHSAQYTLELITSQGVRVHSARGYLVMGDYDEITIRDIATGCLANPLIHTVTIHRWPVDGRLEAALPHEPPVREPMVEEIDLDIDDAELARLSQARTLALSIEEMKAISRYISDPSTRQSRKKAGLGEKITDVELECLAQTWSEHCKHKIFNAVIDYEDGTSTTTINSLFATYIKGATQAIRSAAGEKDICV
ncbi:MAG TPA: phosphoribosylformylglycinamidine synthase, partial [Deltaproteobacteria bacterium]|nr:phosphoribosylformylglycinamidine synthase [Deltaproteobacteria bacterium]